MSKLRKTIELPVMKIVPSGTNPRGKFSFDHMADELLVASVAQHGVLEPILVRPAGDVYEIVFGHRRWAAARKAGLEKIPVMIEELDPETLEAYRLIENDMRVPVDPIEEADAYVRLEEKLGSAEAVAVLVSRPLRHVVRRLQLRGTSAKLRKVYAKRLIDAAMLESLARLDRQRQDEAADWISRAAQSGGFDRGDIERFVNESLLRLCDADWKLQDAELVPEAGACSACPKRTATQQALFDDVQHERCLDEQCWKGKLRARVAQIQAGKNIPKIWMPVQEVVALESRGERRHYDRMIRSDFHLPSEFAPVDELVFVKHKRVKVGLVGLALPKTVFVSRDGLYLRAGIERVKLEGLVRKREGQTVPASKQGKDGKTVSEETERRRLLKFNRELHARLAGPVGKAAKKRTSTVEMGEIETELLRACLRPIVLMMKEPARRLCERLGWQEPDLWDEDTEMKKARSNEATRFIDVFEAATAAQLIEILAVLRFESGWPSSGYFEFPSVRYEELLASLGINWKRERTKLGTSVHQLWLARAGGTAKERETKKRERVRRKLERAKAKTKRPRRKR